MAKQSSKKKIAFLFTVNAWFDKYILLFFFVTAFLLRTAFLQTNLFFGPEQGIDFLAIKGIVASHKLTLIGAKTDISGIFHGPIYYYITAIPFFFSHGDPLAVAYFLIFINCLTVFLIYKLCMEIANRRTGLISAGIFSISFLTVIYPRWLSTHPLSLLLSVLFFLLFVRFIKGHRVSLALCAIVFGLVSEAEFLNLLFFTVMTVILIGVYHKQFFQTSKLYLLLCALLAIIFSIGPFTLFDLRHHYLITGNIFRLLKGGSGYHIQFSESLFQGTYALVVLLDNVFFPIGQGIGAGIFLALFTFFVIKILRVNKIFWILPIWVLVPPTLLIVLRQIILDQYYVAIIPAVIIILGVSIDTLFRRRAWLSFAIILAIVVANLYAFSINMPNNSNIFFQSTQPELKYSDEISVINSIYQIADKHPFNIQTYTIPYWSQEGWEYLFWQYGLQRYGYLPISQNAKLLFVIIQHDPSDIIYQNAWLKNTVSTWGIRKRVFTKGDLTVEELLVPNGK